MKIKNKNLYAVILAGGIGSRLWPLSRRLRPKQVQSILSGPTLLQQTFKLLRRGLPPSHIYLVTTRDQLSIIRKQLPELAAKNFIVEPQRRHTAAAIALANKVISLQNPQAIIVTTNTDGYIPQADKYWQAIDMATRAVMRNTDCVVAIGIRPTYPETGYGYIHLSNKLFGNLYQVKSFKEKPSLSRAKYFVSRSDYLWNSGIYIFKAVTMQSQLAKYLPLHDKVLSAWQAHTNSKNRWAKLSYYYHRLPMISIDVGIIEKQKNLLSLSADFIWQDIGHWRAVRDIIASLPDELTDKSGGKVLNLTGKNNLVKNLSDKLVVTIDLQDMIVVNMDDVVLVCPSSSAQKIKQVVSRLEKNGWEEYL
ncbi:MAG: mannose-1-phosphate guanylyltransferase [Candidatus Komeilibacteria bacterium]